MKPTQTALLETQRLIDIGRMSDAIPIIGRAIASDPQSPELRCLLSLAHYRLNRYEESLSAAEGAVAIAPHSEWANRLRALNLLELGRRHEALNSAREAARLGPTVPEALQVLAKCLAGNGMLPEATETAAALIRLAPDRPLSHRTAGNVAIKRNDWIGAEDHYRIALSINPEDSASMNNLGVALRQQGKDEEAIERFHDAARLDPKSEVSRENLRQTVGGYVSFGVFLICTLLYAIGIMPLPLLGGYRPLGLWVGAVLCVPVAVGYILWRRQRIAGLGKNVQQFYQAETRLRQRKKIASLSFRVVFSITVVALISGLFVAINHIVRRQ